MLTRAQRRTLSFGLQTVLGLQKRGFFIPLRTAPAASAWAGRDYSALRAHFDAHRETFKGFLSKIDALRDDLVVLKGPPPEPRFNQTWCPRLDAAALYSLVRSQKPAQVIEVGSGHSTRFFARAVRDGALKTKITAIDPQPRADLKGLPIALHQKTLQDCDLGLFQGLRAGDVLFVDSSHVLMPGTDVDLIINHVIPHLPKGVVVGFHDIFLPAPYPAAWPFTVYNEQNAVAPLMRHAHLLFASAFVVGEMGEALAGSWIGQQPLEEGARESLLLMEL
ncbi:MAG: class I SAM-dependent methyltransferase [Pseudomonadota bacterium]